MVEQGTHKPAGLTAVLSRVGPKHESVSYRLYRRQIQEHITPIERISDSSFLRASRRLRPEQSRCHARDFRCRFDGGLRSAP